MTDYYWFGGSPGARVNEDYLQDPSTGARLANSVVTITDASNGSVITDLLDRNGAPATTISSDADGFITFAAPAPVVRIDAGYGQFEFYSSSLVQDVIALAPQLDSIQASASASAYSASLAQAAAQAAAVATPTQIDNRLGGPSSGLIDSTGKVVAAKVPDLSALYGAKATVDANTTAITGNSNAIAQLQQVANTTDHLITTCTVSTATTGHILLAAPYNLTIAQVLVTSPAAALAADDVNYMTVELFRFRAGATASIGLKTTKTPASGGEALVINQPWTFDGASLTASRMQMSPLDGLRVNITKTGTATLPLELHFTIRWVPGLV